MIICIPDDYHGLVAHLDCFKRLAAHDARILREAAPPVYERRPAQLRVNL